MPSVSQGLGDFTRTAPAHSRFLHEGAPPASAGTVDTLGDDGVIYCGQQQNIGVYIKAVDAAVTVAIQGRIQLNSPRGDGLVTGDWVELDSIVQALDTAGFHDIAIADGALVPNQLRIQWSATGAAATSQVGLAIS